MAFENAGLDVANGADVGAPFAHKRNRVALERQSNDTMDQEDCVDNQHDCT